MSTDNVNQVLDEYLACTLEWILDEMSKPYHEPTPAHLINKFQLVCLDNNHDMRGLRAMRLRQYHDSDRVFQMERLKNFSQKIPEHITNIFSERILALQSSHQDQQDQQDQQDHQEEHHVTEEFRT